MHLEKDRGFLEGERVHSVPRCLSRWPRGIEQCILRLGRIGFCIIFISSTLLVSCGAGAVCAARRAIAARSHTRTPAVDGMRIPEHAVSDGADRPLLPVLLELTASAYPFNQWTGKCEERHMV